MPTACLFCKIAANQIPSQKIYEDEAILAFHDIHPQAPVHVLIVPREHVAGMDQAEDRHANLLGRMLLTARSLAKQLGLENGYRLVINNGEDAGQAVPHIHLHLLGGRPLSWPPG